MSKYPDGPPPSDGYEYIWVNTREGGYWRKKQSSYTLNETLTQNMSLTAPASAAALNIRQRLATFLGEMDTARFIGRVSGRLKKAWNKSGCFHYSFMENYEMEPYRELGKIYSYASQGRIENNEIVYTINLERDAVKKLTQTITGYFFELILLSGDPSIPEKLRIDIDTSPHYSFHSPPTGVCVLKFPLPAANVPWMVMLKVISLVNDKPSEGKKHSLMKVVIANPLL